MSLELIQNPSGDAVATSTLSVSNTGLEPISNITSDVLGSSNLTTSSGLLLEPISNITSDVLGLSSVSIQTSTGGATTTTTTKQGLDWRIILAIILVLLALAGSSSRSK